MKVIIFTLVFSAWVAMSITAWEAQQQQKKEIEMELGCDLCEEGYYPDDSIYAGEPCKWCNQTVYDVQCNNEDCDWSGRRPDNEGHCPKCGKETLDYVEY